MENSRIPMILCVKSLLKRKEDDRQIVSHDFTEGMIVKDMAICSSSAVARNIQFHVKGILSNHGAGLEDDGAFVSRIGSASDHFSSALLLLCVLCSPTKT